MFAIVKTTDATFTDWLIKEMESRGWSQSELARRAGLSPSAISELLAGRRNPGVDFCNGVASAFHLSPEAVYRLAGLLPPEPEPDILASTGLRILQKLKGERKSDAIRILEAQLKAQEETEKNAGRKRKTAET